MTEQEFHEQAERDRLAYTLDRIGYTTFYSRGVALGERKAEARIKEYLLKKRTELVHTVKHMPCHRIELLDNIIDSLFKEE